MTSHGDSGQNLRCRLCWKKNRKKARTNRKKEKYWGQICGIISLSFDGLHTIFQRPETVRGEVRSSVDLCYAATPEVIGEGRSDTTYSAEH